MMWREDQGNFHLKDGNEAVLINLDQSKTFDRVDHRFLVTVLETAGFKPEFRRWISMMYHNPQAVVQVNGKRSEAFAIGSVGLSAVPSSLRPRFEAHAP